MSEDVKKSSVHIHSRTDELIACLEGEIAKRDARIVELEGTLDTAVSWDVEQLKVIHSLNDHNNQLRAELSALKAQEPDSEHLQEMAHACTYFNTYGKPIELSTAPEVRVYIDGVWGCGYSSVLIPPGAPFMVYYSSQFQKAYFCKPYKSAGQLAAPVSEAKAQGVVMPDVNAAAKALCNRHAMICGVNADDQWKEYSQDFIADAETVLANARLNAAPVQQVSVPASRDTLTLAYRLITSELKTLANGSAIDRYKAAQCELRAMIDAPAAPAADAGESLIEWTKDAVQWGGALNYAAWEFVNECPEKSALLFNNTKGPLRAAIMKYAEIVAANAKDSSHD